MDKRKGRIVLSRRLENEFKEHSDHYEMFVTRKKETFSILISKCDYEKVKQYRWCMNAYGYVTSHRCWKETGHLFLHKYILGNRDGFLVDHKSRDIRDNKRGNLRYATSQTNSMNTKVLGVSLRKDTGKWTALIVISGKRKCLGCFDTFDEARSARIVAENKYFLPLIEGVAQ